jgi:hypothetical protein
MNLENWHKEYLPNEKYLNYICYDVPEIFDLHKIDPITGNTSYVRSDFKHSLVHLVNKNPSEYVLKEHDSSKLDEHLMPVNETKSQSFSFLKKIVTKIQAINNPNKNPKSPPFTRYEKISLWFMGLAVIVPIIIFMLS